MTPEQEQRAAWRAFVGSHVGRRVAVTIERAGIQSTETGTLGRTHGGVPHLCTVGDLTIDDERFLPVRWCDLDEALH